MTNTDRTAFVAVMSKLAEVYREALTEGLLEAYWDALHDYELEYLEPAAAKHIRESKWFPKPVELRELASQYRVDARRKALPDRLQKALEGPKLTADEVKAFLAELRARPEHAEALAEIPKKGVEALHDDARRLDALGGRDMTDEKREALAQFTRYRESR